MIVSLSMPRRSGQVTFLGLLNVPVCMAVCLMCAFVVATSCVAAPLRIGIPVPLSGANSAYGREIRRGFELGKEILGLNDIQFIFEDDACDGAKSVTIIKKLLEVDKVDLISGIFCNTALLSAAPLLNRAKIPVLTVGATTGDRRGVGERIFRMTPADHLALGPLIPEMEKEGRHLCILTETDAYSALIERTIVRDWPSRGFGFTVSSESVNAGERDFRTALLRLTGRGCDSLFINTCGDDGFIAAFKQYKAINPGISVFALYFPGSAAIQEALADSLKGVVYADLPTRGTLATALGAEFVRRYEARYGSFITAMPVSLLAFEALRLISQAHKEGVPLDQFLRRGPIRDGAIREYSFDSDGAVQGINFQVVRY